jgi:hypothetical protein
VHIDHPRQHGRIDTVAYDHAMPERSARFRRMSIENPLWDAPSVDDELLKAGFDVTQSSVTKSTWSYEADRALRNGPQFSAQPRARHRRQWTIGLRSIH